MSGEELKKQIPDTQEEPRRKGITRRQFLASATAVGVAQAVGFGLRPAEASPVPAPAAEEVKAPVAQAEPKAGHMIVFDPYQCTGCMICAVACAEKWAPKIAPDATKDVVNLEFSRIRPMRFQYVDVINICTYCKLLDWAEGSNEYPCQAVCPQDAIVTVPEGQGEAGYTGMGYITIDREKCLGLDLCGRCLEICEDQFGSGISFDPIEKKAQICTMCGGTPTCVEVCPEPIALQFVPVQRNGRYYAHPPEAFAEILYRKIFNKRRDL